MKVLYIITARGGSKGVPRKNIRKIAGRPLVAYKILTAKKCGYKGRIIVSTDDSEIAEVAKKYGAQVPFVRPGHLSSDTASSMDVVAHAMDWVMREEGNIYDCVCLLEPSSPFAYPSDLQEALRLFEEGGTDTIVGVKEVDVARKFIWPLDHSGKMSLFYKAVRNMEDVRRQGQDKEYTLNGCFYIAGWDYFRKNRIFHSENGLPYIMPAERSIEIDTSQELAYCEFCVAQGLVDIHQWD